MITDLKEKHAELDEIIRINQQLLKLVKKINQDHDRVHQIKKKTMGYLI